METGYVYALGAAIIWGVVYAIDQKILSGISPSLLLIVNWIIGTLVLLPIIFLKNPSFQGILASVKANWFLVLATSILAAIANYLILSGIKSLNASSISIIEIAYPFFVVLFSYFFFGSVPNKFFFIGGALMFIGSVIIIKFT